MYDKEEFRLWLCDRFEPEELFLYVDIKTDDLLDAFPEEIEDNEQLLTMFLGEPDEDGDE